MFQNLKIGDVFYYNLKGINFREDLFSRGNFFQKLFNFRGTYFREDGNCKFARELNFASFARNGIFFENSKPEDRNSWDFVKK